MSDASSSRRQSSLPEVRAVTTDDLRDALKKGWTDFLAAPLFGLFFGSIFAIGGLILIATLVFWKVYWLAYPLIIGFALIGPFIATGLYDVSRRLELDQPLSWSGVLGVVWTQHRRELGWMAFVTLFIFWIWVYQARTLFVVFFGSKGFASIDGFVESVLTTADGWWFLLAGHIVGAIIAFLLFALTVISFPLLLDRDCDFVTAMITSIRAVSASPIVMGGWGLFVIASVMLAAIPAFLGLLIVLPILGHATWHLYRMIVPPTDESGA